MHICCASLSICHVATSRKSSWQTLITSDLIFSSLIFKIISYLYSDLPSLLLVSHFIIIPQFRMHTTDSFNDT